MDFALNKQNSKVNVVGNLSNTNELNKLNELNNNLNNNIKKVDDDDNDVCFNFCNFDDDCCSVKNSIIPTVSTTTTCSSYLSNNINNTNNQIESKSEITNQNLQQTTLELDNRAQTNKNTNKNNINNYNGKFFEGQWLKIEHIRFIEGILKYGTEWKKVEEHIQTRSGVQARSHAQKFFSKVKIKNGRKEEKESSNYNLYNSSFIIINILFEKIREQANKSDIEKINYTCIEDLPIYKLLFKKLCSIEYERKTYVKKEKNNQHNNEIDLEDLKEDNSSNSSLSNIKYYRIYIIW